jgi:hypothetical protein
MHYSARTLAASISINSYGCPGRVQAVELAELFSDYGGLDKVTTRE